MSDPSRPDVDLDAACACGAVHVRVKGRVRSMLLCSCEDCQRATGAGHSAIAIFGAGDVTIAGPVQRFERSAASGATLVRSFCPTCGTPLAGRSSRWPDALLMPAGLFGSDTAWYAPTQLIFARSHRDWDSIDPGLPRHETYRQKREEH